MSITLGKKSSQTSAAKKRKPKVMRSDAQWKALLESYSEGELTKSEFCKKHRISTSSFYKWEKRLGLNSAVNEFVDITESLSTTPTTSVDFPTTAPAPGWQVELELGPGIVLRVRTS